MPLTRYRAKRDFAQTTEPSGEATLPAGARFVVQQHAARRMHYDFRLEIGGVLKSWAVPKGPSLDPADKRLAVATEDHPVSYASFEGHIPKSQYGGGNVIVWDAGTWEVPDNAQQALHKGHLRVVLHGQKLSGAFSLIRMGTQNAWLLRKLDDAWARPGSDIARAQPQSILTGKRVENVHKTTSGGARKKRGKQRASHKAQVFDATDPLPAALAPQLATLAEVLPTQRGWVYELKYDGYRLLARKTGHEVTLWTRNGHDWTERLAPIAQAVGRLPSAQLVLDGELVVTDAAGQSSFAHLQQALREGATEALTYCIFDVLAQDGKDMRQQPLAKRRSTLQALCDHAHPIAPLHLVAQTTQAADGKRLLAAACARGFEGVVAKNARAVYAGGRSEDWLKVKCSLSGEWLVGGYTVAKGTRQTLGSLLLGAYDAKGALHYCGGVGTGLSERAAPELWPALQRRKTRKHPFGSAAAQLPKACVFVKPTLVVQVAYQQQLASGALRHARLTGLRPDKDPAEVRMPHAPDDEAAQGSIIAEPIKPTPASPRLTHPRRRVAPKTTVTKGELVQYVQAATSLVLAHAGHRPLSLLRCPKADLKQQFFQKHLRPLWPGFGSAKLAGKDYPVLETQEGLLACVQHNVLEWHIWGCRADALAHPDMLTFDLDPGEGVQAGQLIAAAHTMRDVLQSLGFDSWLKLTGGKGLHVVMPVAPERSWTETKGVCRLIADYVVAKDPAHFTAVMRKSARRGRVFVDYFRNHQGATAVAPYSCRARPGLPIARPLAWSMLSAQVLAAPWGVPQMRQALSAGYQDPWLSGAQIGQQRLGDTLCREALKYAKRLS